MKRANVITRKTDNIRSEKLRKKYIGILFDASNSGINQDLKVQFAKDVLDKDKPVILNFHGGNWFSEVHTTFTMNGKNVPVTLFMELEKHHHGTRWVISKVYADVFKPYFERDTTKVGKISSSVKSRVGLHESEKGL